MSTSKKTGIGSCSCCTLPVLFGICVVSVLFFILSFVLAFSIFPMVLKSEVNKAVELEEGTEQYDRFVELPFPIDFKVYIFNVENADAVKNNGSKPKLREIGPFVYKQYRHKTILETDDEEDTVTYRQLETFEFDQEASGNLTEDTTVTVLNPALLSIFHLSSEYGYLASAVEKCILPTFPEGYDDIFITVPVKHLLFDGFNFCINKGDDLCALVNDIVCTIASTKRNVDILADYSLHFSFLNYKTRAPDGKYTVNRGLREIESLGHIMSWNDLKYTTYWGSETQCSKVKGTDSTLYPPRVSKDESFYIFATDICRFVEIKYKGEGSYKGIDGYLFGTDENTLRSTTEDPNNDCYCTKMSKDVNGTPSCFLDGIVDMQSCFGVPVLFSFPHFLWADEQYSNGVENLKPDEEKHKTFLLVEPETGNPLQGVKRIQLNAVIRPIFGIKTLNNMAKAVLPLLWIEEGVSLTDKYIDELQSRYFNIVKILDGVKYALIAISTILEVVFGVLVVRKKFFSKR